MSQIHPENPSLWRKAYDMALAQAPTILEAGGKHAAKIAEETTKIYRQNGGKFTNALSEGTKKHLANVFGDLAKGGKKALLYAGEELPVAEEAAEIAVLA